MRKLNFEDVFTITKIIKKMNIKNEIKECIGSVNKSDKSKSSVESLGIDIALIFIENVGNAEREVYSLFSSLTGKKVEEVKKLELTEIVDMIKELFTNEDVKKVFSTALNLKK